MPDPGPRLRRRVALLVVLALVTAAIGLLLDRHLRPSRGIVVEPNDDQREARQASASLPQPGPPRRREALPSTSELPSPDAAATTDRETGALSGDVVDSADAPVSAAEVSVLDADGRVLTRTESGTSGEFRVTGCETGALVVVRHRAASTLQVPVVRPADGGPVPPMRIRLAIGAAVEGDVRLPTGAAPAQPVRVTAVPLTSGPLTIEQAQAAARDDPRAATTQSDGDGRFRIDGLRPGDHYAVFAAGPGLAQITKGGPASTSAVAGGGPVHLTVAPLYVLSVRVRGPAGEPLESSTKLGMWHSWKDPPDSLGQFGPGTPMLSWASVPWFARRAFDDSFDVQILLAAKHEGDQFGPIEFSAFPPGYKAAVALVYAPRAAATAPVTQEIRLERTATAFGKLVVRLDEQESRLRDVLRAASATCRSRGMRLRLFPADRDALGRAYLEVSFGQDLSEAVELNGIPAGRYRAVFHAPFGQAAAPGDAPWLTIDPQAAAEYTVRVPTWTAIELNPSIGGADAPSYDGPLTVTVRRSGTAVVSEWSFSKRPYCIVGIEPRSYEVSARRGPLESRWISVEPKARDVTRVDVRIEQPATR